MLRCLHPRKNSFNAITLQFNFTKITELRARWAMHVACSRTSINRLEWLNIGKLTVNEVPNKIYDHVTISSTSPEEITTNKFKSSAV